MSGGSKSEVGGCPTKSSLFIGQFVGLREAGGVKSGGHLHIYGCCSKEHCIGPVPHQHSALAVFLLN